MNTAPSMRCDVAGKAKCSVMKFDWFQLFHFVFGFTGHSGGVQEDDVTPSAPPLDLMDQVSGYESTSFDAGEYRYTTSSLKILLGFFSRPLICRGHSSDDCFEILRDPLWFLFVCERYYWWILLRFFLLGVVMFFFYVLSGTQWFLEFFLWYSCFVCFGILKNRFV